MSDGEIQRTRYIDPSDITTSAIEWAMDLAVRDLEDALRDVTVDNYAKIYQISQRISILWNALSGRAKVTVSTDCPLCTGEPVRPSFTVKVPPWGDEYENGDNGGGQ